MNRLRGRIFDSRSPTPNHIVPLADQNPENTGQAGQVFIFRLDNKSIQRFPKLCRGCPCLDVLKQFEQRQIQA